MSRELWSLGRNSRSVGGSAVRIGDRVELLHTDDPWTKLKPGLRGTVVDIDDAGTVHVTWDNGARLGMVADSGDRFAVIH